MPAILQKIDLDFAEAERECSEFKAFLQNKHTFSETAVVNELKKFTNLTCLLGQLVAGVPKADVYKFEFQVLGVFRADLVVGNSQTRRLVFVEFEGGEEHSLFGPPKTAQMQHWAHQLEHGFGQVVDWAWAINDAGNSKLLNNAFGFELASAASAVICGRDALMDATEFSRFNWRAHNVAVGQATAKSTCLTYDGLLTFFEGTIAAVRSLLP